MIGDSKRGHADGHGANPGVLPSAEWWEEFYGRWRRVLVNKLGKRHGAADCEDAVEFAFQKMMSRKCAADFVRLPENEKEWYGCVYWQAKAYLSHLAKGRKTREACHRSAWEEDRLVPRKATVCAMDREIRDRALFETFKAVCAEAKVNPRNAEAYVRRYLNGETSESVAGDLGITTTHLYVIKCRIERLLAKEGKRHYAAISRRLFRQAA